MHSVGYFTITVSGRHQAQNFFFLVRQIFRFAEAFEFSRHALQSLQEVYVSGRASEAETSTQIAASLAQTTELLCPHSAVGVKVAQEHLDPSSPMITLATAHPAKFPDAVEAATGVRPPLPSRMGDLYERPERVTRVPNDLGALKTHIQEALSA